MLFAEASISGYFTDVSLKLIQIQITLKLNSLSVQLHTAHISPPCGPLKNTTTGICCGASNLPQSLSITSLSLTRSLSKKSKLDVLRGCLCNLFMTAQVCVDAVVADVNKRDTEVDGWNMPFHWKAF